MTATLDASSRIGVLARVYDRHAPISAAGFEVVDNDFLAVANREDEIDMALPREDLHDARDDWLAAYGHHRFRNVLGERRGPRAAPPGQNYNLHRWSNSARTTRGSLISRKTGIARGIARSSCPALSDGVEAIVIVPSDGISADLEACLILDGADEVEGGMADDGQIGWAMISARPHEIIVGTDIHDPVEPESATPESPSFSGDSPAKTTCPLAKANSRLSNVRYRVGRRQTLASIREAEAFIWMRERAMGFVCAAARWSPLGAFLIANRATGKNLFACRW